MNLQLENKSRLINEIDANRFYSRFIITYAYAYTRTHQTHNVHTQQPVIRYLFFVCCFFFFWFFFCLLRQIFLFCVLYLCRCCRRHSSTGGFRYYYFSLLFDNESQRIHFYLYFFLVYFVGLTECEQCVNEAK